MKRAHKPWSSSIALCFSGYDKKINKTNAAHIIAIDEKTCFKLTDTFE